jgi:hypothetical protein
MKRSGEPSGDGKTFEEYLVPNQQVTFNGSGILSQANPSKLVSACGAANFKIQNGTIRQGSWLQHSDSYQQHRECE